MEALLDLPTNYWEEILHEPDVYNSKSSQWPLMIHLSVTHAFIQFTAPQAKMNGNLRKFAATTGGGKSMHAMSPYSYRSATSSVYGTPAGVSRLVRDKIAPTKLFPGSMI